MGKHKMELTEQLRGEVIAAWNNSGGTVLSVAVALGVCWQTAKRWLTLAGITRISERLDRPGLAWPCFEVKIHDNRTIFVEAHSWPIACKATEARIGLPLLEVRQTDEDASHGYDRASVKVLLPGYMDRSKSISDLAQHYLDAGVVVR